MKIFNNNKGFTLIELLMVIAIMGILSSIVIATINNSRAKARDAIRKQDLYQAKIAINLYYDKYGNWLGTGSGCGRLGNGYGYFSYTDGSSYLVAMSQCLVDEGLTSKEIVDPSGARSGSNSTNSIYNYMKWNCSGGNSYIFAKLETVAQSTTATDGVSCCTDCDTVYGMNYYVQIN
jgi:prepilin-type N-terminal cleavage/methylation domain-containing protein